jgi:carboxyl-terminal processing protease
MVVRVMSKSSQDNRMIVNSLSCRDLKPWRDLVLVLAFLTLTPLLVQTQNVQRGETEDILKIVSADVRKNFYDPQMKGLDWAALTEQARQQIESSNNTGKMFLAIVSLLDKLQDSHTYFVPPPLTQQADFGFNARPYGADIRVYEIANKGPAGKAGLSLGDKITSLNGIAVDRASFSEILRLLEVVVPAAALDAEVVSAGGQTRTVHIPAHMILRQEHQYYDSVWRVADRQRAMDVHVNFSHKDYGDGIAYVAVPSFSDRPDLTYAAVKKADHAHVLILDLRGNHGGWRDTVLSFLGFFNQQPQLLMKRVFRSRTEDEVIKPQQSGFSGSVIVLVDSDSASAAELAARHLQLTYKAQVIGDNTAGKVNDGYVIREKIGARFITPFAVSVTDAKLVMPDGGELEGHGVVPDIYCLPTADDLVKQRDPCLDQALDLATKSTVAKSPSN